MTDSEIERISILNQLQTLLERDFDAIQLVQGSLCLTRRVYDPSVGRQVNELSAACGFEYRDRVFYLRCVQKEEKDGIPFKYSIQLNSDREVGILEEGYSPERGPHRSEFKDGRKIKGVHIKTSGALGDIARRIVGRIKQGDA